MIPILYGSQTGTSIYVSRLIERAITHGYDPKTIYDLESFFGGQAPESRCIVQEMDLFDIETILDMDLVIFVCSTHGDGGEPFNMSRFWSFLSRNDLPSNLLSHLSFAVFGLGDSSYEKFNYCSKRLFNRLKMLGGTPVVRRGSGDGQEKNGFLSGLRPWLQDLLGYLKTYTPKPYPTTSAPQAEKYTSQLVEKRRLTPEEHPQEIVEFVFNIPEYKGFSPGDCLSFLPENYNYREFMSHNGIEDGDVDGVSSTWIIRNVIDFNSLPHQPFFFELWYFLNRTGSCSKEVLEKIDEIAQDYDLYHDYVVKPRRTIFEVLKDLRLRVSISFLKGFVPAIYPRFFSVTRKSGLYRITVAIVKHTTILPEPRRSICSEYLLGLGVGDTVLAGIGRSNLYFDSDRLLFICTGVGISLPRACVNEFRDKEIVIFYGFRHRHRDLLYPEEWTAKNVRLLEAASRDDGVYVQDVFRKNPVEDIDRYLVFVSGSSRLSKEVARLFQDVYGRRVVFQAETW